ncbi:hypothetical protein F5X99DRAFT_369284 [Biscogniauxia marginata]|nr:hypothetical protein F5X99DRAFT_369284 [Biscogniauxia marginata]
MAELLRHGARLRGSGVIVLATEAGQVEMVRFLLANGAKTDGLGVEDPTDKESRLDVGSTLHRAICHDHAANALLLTDAGADIELKDAQGRTFREPAEQFGQTEVLDRMQSRGIRSSQAWIRL